MAKKNYYDLTKEGRTKLEKQYDKTNFGRDSKKNVILDFTVAAIAMLIIILNSVFQSYEIYNSAVSTFIFECGVTLFIISCILGLISFIIYYINFLNWLDVKDND